MNDSVALNAAGRPGGDARGGQVVVEARDLTKIFSRGDVVALENVDFSVAHGEFVSVVGPSGCGKSTLLRLTAGLVRSTSGSLLVHGREIDGPRAETAMMFQSPKLLPWKTALQNVVLPRRIAGTLEAAAWAQARELLDLLGLGSFANAYPAHLSGGMQQRVALARVLITGAELLLMDEPFAALDEFTRERLNLELLRIQRDVDATVIFITHNITEAVFLADRVLVMTPHPGRLAGIIDVPFPRPREISLLKSGPFNDMAFEVRALLGESV